MGIGSELRGLQSHIDQHVLYESMRAGVTRKLDICYSSRARVRVRVSVRVRVIMRSHAGLITLRSPAGLY